MNGVNVIDVSRCKTIGEIHLQIKEGMGFSEGYGENLDALWDSLTGMKRNPGDVILRGTQKVPGELRDYMDQVVGIFFEAAGAFGEFCVTLES